MMKPKRETLIIIFYVMYFSWLLTVTFISNDALLLNYFVGFIVLFYFTFLKGGGDLFWFTAGFSFVLAMGVFSFSSTKLSFSYNFEAIKLIPLWLPLAWGTTFVALKKFYETMTTRIS